MRRNVFLSLLCMCSATSHASVLNPSQSLTFRMDCETVLITNVTDSYYYNLSHSYSSVALEPLWYRYDIYTGGAIAAAYSLVFLVGLFGNLLVTLAVLRGDREMRQSVTNIFLVNLAIADLLVIITCLPFTLITNLIYRISLMFFFIFVLAYLKFLL